MKILAIESSCDETSAAVVEKVDGGFRILSNIVASQIETHRLYGGVVPEIASRAHIEAVSGVTREALETAGITVKDLISLAAGKNTSIADACKYLSEVGLCAKDYINRELDNTLSGGELKRIELAMALAKKALFAADLDIVSSSVALRFLCRAELLNKNYDFDKIVEFLKISLGTKEKAERQAKHLLRQKEEC